MMTSRLTAKTSDRVPYALIWKQPLSLWLIPLISLFIMSTLPLLASRGWGWNIESHAFVMIVMCFVLAHRFFGFVHDTAACDFYFALPGRRSTMFFHLNLASITYLIGPSVLIALLNTLLFTLFFQSVPPDAYPGALYFYAATTSGPATVFAVIALYLKIIFLFMFLQLFYLLSDRAGRANTMALLINLFWPIMIFLYTDATRRFLPGFPGEFKLFGQSFSPWFELLICQILSPLSAIVSTLGFDGQFWIYAILPVATWFLCRNLFIKRQVEYARLSAKIDWPFAITQWIGVLSTTLLGGYACHLLRALIYDATKNEAAAATPAPFLIGCGLGLILSLWIFNLIRGKGKLAWKPLIAASLAVLIPFSAWLGVVMSGANGYSERWPDTDQIQSIEIIYPESSLYEREKLVVTLKEKDDIADISALVHQLFRDANLGLATPRTLQSRTLSDAYVFSLLYPQNSNNDSYLMNNTFFWSELRLYYVDLVCHTANGATIHRKNVLPHNPANPYYRNLLLRNNKFLLAEYGGWPSHLIRYEQGSFPDPIVLEGVLQATLNVETTKENLTEMESVWESRLVSMVYDDQYEDARRAVFFAKGLCETVAHDILSQSDEVYQQLLSNAPFIVHVHLTYSPNRPDANPSKTDTNHDGKTGTNNPNHTTSSSAQGDLENKTTSEYNVPWSADLTIPVNPESTEMARFLGDQWLLMQSYAEAPKE